VSDEPEETTPFIGATDVSVGASNVSANIFVPTTAATDRKADRLFAPTPPVPAKPLQRTIDCVVHDTVPQNVVARAVDAV
jgi:hypothetical protein